MSFSKRSFRRPTVDCGPGLTRPEFLNQCTPRIQVERFIRDGVYYQTPLSPQFGDFTNIGSYQECLNRVISIDQTFDSLPSAVRAKFRNDPGALITFLSNPDNRDEAISLGLLDKKANQL
ncbi:internal scaffolding protein VP3 [Gokushovirinae Bog8989_22]|uniref:internal scaffolding protein VP3 n=1 Tax=Gokushovirinae Bog8989_22 TaxID=1655650 RepID=UPI00063D5F32|nr:internal scaffolding protein VP3 [Gokushovirinae Bog8989_22]AKI26890.1 internal scaffolding protein VP3 [Gokushovirinae Bog8989_22]